MRPNRWLAPVMLLSFFTLQGRIQAAEEIIELQLQHSKCLCGVVTYANGDPAQNARVEEFGPDWKEALRSTNTGSDGQFALAPVKGRHVYYLQVSARAPGVNPLRVPVQISRFRGTKLLRLRLHLA
jgi:hypothetical protein